MRSELGGKIDLMRSELGSIYDKIDLMRSELGSIYEISARQEIAKINGFHYSSRFEISDLNGLVQLCLPRKKFSNESPKYDSQIYIQTYHADKLANYIYVGEYKLLRWFLHMVLIYHNFLHLNSKKK
jgi:hypothetical protein